jgi:hypothetical protein
MSGGELLETLSASDTPPRMYLPSEADLGTGMSWTYAYVLSIYAASYQMQLDINVTGTYVERPSQSVTVEGETVDAYKLANTYRMEFDGIEGIGGEFTRDGYIEELWVKGIGLYSEDHSYTLDDGTGAQIVKTLSQFSGLTVQN